MRIDNINEIGDKFFLLRKRLRDEEIKELKQKSNKSFIEMLRRTLSKKEVEAPKPNQKFILENSNKSKSENKEKTIPKPQEMQLENPSSPLLGLLKSENKKKSKTKPTKTNQLPKDNLINLAFNKDTIKNIPLPLSSMKPKSPFDNKQRGNNKSNNSNSNMLQISINNINNNNESTNKDIGDRTPAVINDNDDNLSSNVFNKNKREGEEDEGNDGGIDDYYVKKEEIFANNNLLFNDYDSPEIKPFEEEDNKQMDIELKKESKDFIIEDNNKIQEKDNDLNTNEGNNNVIINDSKVVIPLDALLNIKSSENNIIRGEDNNDEDTDYFNLNNIIDSKQNKRDNKQSEDTSYKNVSKKEKHESNVKRTPTTHSNQKNKERKISTSSSKAPQNIINTAKHINHNHNNIHSINQPNNNRNSTSNRVNSDSTQPTLNSNEGLKSLANIHSTITEYNQPPTFTHEIKKKEYDIVCISMLESLFAKTKTKYTNSTSNDLSSSSSSSSVAKHFDDINKILFQLNSDDPSKRVKHITEKTMKILLLLCDIFENEKKREFYLYDILQIIDVIHTFQHKTKINFGQKVPQWFKLIKLCFKYISSLFRIKGYSINQLKELVNQNDNDNRTKNLVKFTKCYKSFVSSVDKLKSFLIKNGNEDKKQKKTNDTLLIYLETNPNAIKYSKCFKVSKKFIEYIFDYLASEKIKE